MRKKEAAGKREREIPEWKSQAKPSRGGSVIVTHRRRGDEDENRRGWGGGSSWRERDRKNVDFWEGFPAGFPPFLGEERGTGQWVGPLGKNLSGGSKHDLIRQAVSPPLPLWQRSHYFSAGAL